jgi:hypothetical protein
MGIEFSQALKMAGYPHFGTPDRWAVSESVWQ